MTHMNTCINDSQSVTSCYSTKKGNVIWHKLIALKCNNNIKRTAITIEFILNCWM